MVARLGFAAATAAIIVGGSLTTNGWPAGVTIGMLVPTLIFLAGVRSPGRVVVFGSLLAGITALSWLILLANVESSTSGLNLGFGVVCTLFSSIVGASLDLIDPQPRRHPRTGAGGEGPPPPPRAW